jgi:hypothetical protein
MNGGNSTGYFKLERGARQGDPISAYLFILVMEIFFQMIRKNRGIKGIEICGHVFNIVAYADDATGFVNDLESARLLLKTFGIFSKYSGLRLNESKTEICGIRVKRGLDIALCGISNPLFTLIPHISVFDSFNRRPEYFEKKTSITKIKR